MGGGIMRTATKAAKAAARAPWIDPAMAAGRSTRPLPASLPVAGPIAEGFVSFSPAGSETAAALEKKGSWTGDEWEFAGGVEEEVSEPLRIVFRPVPTLEEAREATEDLKSALTDSSENSDAGRELGMIASYPKHIVQAFSFLKESSQAQEVVASLASDKNVWDAVMKNEMVMQFYKANQIYPSLDEPEKELEINSSKPVETNQNFEESNQIPQETHANSFNSFVDFIKVKMEEIGNKLSMFVKDFMGQEGPAAPQDAAPATATKTAGGDNGGGAAAAVDLSLTASFIALAIATILTILFKRG